MPNHPALANRPVLLTPRLVLRRPEPDDLRAIIAIVGDWEVARWLARVPHPYGPADARFFLEQVVPSEWVWAVTLRGRNDLIGAVGLTPHEEAGAASAELGYWLSRRQWGAGIMTEAASAVIGYGFEKLHLIRITSGYFVQNRASGRILDKLGFVQMGMGTRPCLARQCEVPSIEVGLTRAQGFRSRGEFFV